MVFQYVCVVVLWAKVTSALEGLKESIQSFIKTNNIRTFSHCFTKERKLQRKTYIARDINFQMAIYDMISKTGLNLLFAIMTIWPFGREALIFYLSEIYFSYQYKIPTTSMKCAIACCFILDCYRASPPPPPKKKNAIHF